MNTFSHLRIKKYAEYGRCPSCKKMDFMSDHICPQAWNVRYAEYDDEDSDVVFADTAEDAAIAYIDNGDYENGESEIAVQPIASSAPWKIFKVGAEMIRQFWAEDITPDPEPEEEEDI